MRDWISCNGYAQMNNALAGLVTVFPLIPVPEIGTYQPSMPGGSSGPPMLRWGKIKRIVGQVYWQGSTQVPEESQYQQAGWRLQALPINWENDDLETPWVATDSVLSSPTYTDVDRWWAERWYPAYIPAVGEAEYPQGLDTVSIPWWTQVDVKPNAIVGTEVNEWPCLVVDNAFDLSPLNLNIVHRLRMYGSWRVA